jgi:hypothetical protein
MKPTHIRTAAKRFDGQGRHAGPGPWLDLIHEANRIAPGMFGEPASSGPWWAGGFAEEYPDARVIFRRDEDPESVSVISKTDRGAEILSAAAEKLGL